MSFKPGDWVRCQTCQQQLSPERVYQVLETFNDGLDCQLVGLNVWKGQLWGAWRFQPANTNQG